MAGHFGGPQRGDAARRFLFEADKYLPVNFNSLKQIDAHVSDRDERALLCCALAKRRVYAGDYEGAREALIDYWKRVGELPDVRGLSELTAADVWLCAGVLAGWIGGAKRVEDAQTFAKDLISRGSETFARLGETRRTAEAQIELAYCYLREGAAEEARIFFQAAIDGLVGDDEASDLKALALIRKAAAERVLARHSDSSQSLAGARSLIEASADHGLKGRFHLEFANLLQSLGVSENKPGRMDQALIEYAAASYHFEQAGHARYIALVENNLGYLFHKLGKFAEAHAHLDRAQRLFQKLNDDVFAAQVRETRARTLLAQGKFGDAEIAARGAVRSLEKSGEQAFLAEALTTQATALARLERHSLALSVFERAIDTAAAAGSAEMAGLAALGLMEELGASLPPEKMRDFYKQADELLQRSQDVATLDRLRRQARRVLNFDAVTADALAADSFRDTPTPAAATTVDDMIREALHRHRPKQITFAREAVEAIRRLFLSDQPGELREIVERTAAEAGDGFTVTVDAVETVALRRASDVSFVEPWRNFSLRDETAAAEARFIELALKEASGKISVAAKLLGFAHYESLHSVIKSRHPQLLAARTPPIPRKRSLIRRKSK